MVRMDTQAATFFVSVSVCQADQESSAIGGIHDVLRSHTVPALWAFEFMSPIPLLARLAKTGAQFGILATGSWASSNASRNEFARELQSRLIRMAAMNVQPVAVTTLESEPPAHFDLLVKNQIPLVNIARRDSRTAPSVMPRLSRYGIWQTRPGLVIPDGSRWTVPWTARRLLRQAVDAGQTLHVAVDTRRLAENISSGLAVLDKILRHAEKYRSAGQIRFVSATELLQVYSPRREQVASRSILKAA